MYVSILFIKVWMVQMKKQHARGLDIYIDYSFYYCYAIILLKQSKLSFKACLCLNNYNPGSKNTFISWTSLDN